MTRDEVARVLKERSALLSQPYGPDAIDAWHATLPRSVTLDEALAAMRSACSESTSGRVTVADVVARVEKPKATRLHTDPLGQLDCHECQGTGWSPRFDQGARRYGPCRTCRPKDGTEAKPDPNGRPSTRQSWATDEGRATIAAIRAGLGQRGHTAHGPSCNCDRCRFIAGARKLAQAERDAAGDTAGMAPVATLVAAVVPPPPAPAPARGRSRRARARE
jgi:hypothetical protein